MKKLFLGHVTSYLALICWSIENFMHSYRRLGNYALARTFRAMTGSNRLKNNKYMAKIKFEGLNEGHVICYHSNNIHKLKLEVLTIAMVVYLFKSVQN